MRGWLSPSLGHGIRALAVNADSLCQSLRVVGMQFCSRQADRMALLCCLQPALWAALSDG